MTDEPEAVDRVKDRVGNRARVLTLLPMREAAYEAVENSTAYAAELRPTARHRKLPLRYEMGLG